MEYQFLTEDLDGIGILPDLYASFIAVNKKYEGIFHNDFFRDISDLIHKHTSLYYHQDFISDENTILKIKDCLLISVKLFDEYTSEGDLGKLLISLHVLSFFRQNYNLLDISKINQSYKNKIIKFTTKSILGISVPNDAPYNEKEMVRKFNKAKKKNDLCEVIGIMDNLVHHSKIFESLNHDWCYAVHFLFYLDKTSIIKILNSSIGYEKLEAFVYVLKDSLFEDPSFILKLHNNYATIRCVKYWLVHLDAKYKEFDDFGKMPDYTNILGTILSNQDLKFEKYINVMRIYYSGSYNYLIGWLIAKNPEFLDTYLDNVSFDFKNTSLFSLGFLRSKVTDENLICDVVTRVKSLFLKKEVHILTDLNLLTGYLYLLIFYYNTENKTKNAYLKKLINFSNDIQKAQNSWNHENITALWVDFYYFCLSNNRINKYVFSESELQSKVPVLFDRRNELMYDEKSLKVMRNFLIAPSYEQTIVMKNGIRGEVTLSYTPNSGTA